MSRNLSKSLILIATVLAVAGAQAQADPLETRCQQSKVAMREHLRPICEPAIAALRVRWRTSDLPARLDSTKKAAEALERLMAYLVPEMERIVVLDLDVDAWRKSVNRVLFEHQSEFAYLGKGASITYSDDHRRLLIDTSHRLVGVRIDDLFGASPATVERLVANEFFEDESYRSEDDFVLRKASPICLDEFILADESPVDPTAIYGGGRAYRGPLASTADQLQSNSPPEALSGMAN